MLIEGLDSVEEWILRNLECLEPIVGGVEWRVIFAITCWFIWYRRNKLLFEGRDEGVKGIVATVGNYSINVGEAMKKDCVAVSLQVQKEGVSQLMIECDNLEVVPWVNGDKEPVKSLRTSVNSIEKLILFGWEVQIKHIFRQGSKCADFLANYVSNVELGCHRSEEPLHEVLNWLMHDKVGVAYPRMM
ncbi:uncharacterized protein LOC131171209 [Hevea brasiliensis]|uniref:uncharacterized protein LOC131171209 n=1 Tax=Hevea brasiliensis TaxID=3981 RepID=UPI0025F01FDA|nr:uncharacterized protein LOC131171209 [Hevea brasiliensis]